MAVLEQQENKAGTPFRLIQLKNGGFLVLKLCSNYCGQVLQRDNCPATWFIGKQIKWRGEILELVEINDDEYVWIDVEKTNEKDD